ncbi:MAG: aspartyl protease family protein [bacterium]
MGETFAEVTLRANGKEMKKRILVDTGSTFTWLHSDTLRKLGLKPVDKDEFETIEGRIVERGLCELEIECIDRKTSTWVIFGRRKDSEVLGLHALEGLRVEVDPVRRKIRKLKAIKSL